MTLRARLDKLEAAARLALAKKNREMDGQAWSQELHYYLYEKTKELGLYERTTWMGYLRPGALRLLAEAGEPLSDCFVRYGEDNVMREIGLPVMPRPLENPAAPAVDAGAPDA